MRKIKFRAFYKPKAKGSQFEETTVGMHKVVKISYEQWFDSSKKPWLSKGLEITIRRSNGYHLTCVPDELVLMQYTGLKDKNGKEIYEGDIIGLFWDFGDGEQYITDKIDWVENTGFSPFSTQGIDPSDVEVIGNVYENKNLLKKYGKK